MNNSTNTNNNSPYLMAGEFIDSDHPEVIAFAEQYEKSATGDVERSINLYLAVRDRVLYDPYSIRLSRSELYASHILQLGRGFCVAKAVLYAAVLRAAGIPSRIGFADVKNHLTTPRLRALMGTDVFYHHGYTELLLDGQWVKATPAFNIELCQKFGIKALDFNGREDSIFHPFDTAGQKHMEYVQDHGHRADLPYDELIDTYKAHYPFMFQMDLNTVSGDFHAEADASS